MSDVAPQAIVYSVIFAISDAPRYPCSISPLLNLGFVTFDLNRKRSSSWVLRILVFLGSELSPM